MSAAAQARAAEDDAGFFARLKAFSDNVFEPKLHTAFAALWSLSLLGNLHAVSRVTTWRWDAALLVLVPTVFVCLFFLRMVDEIKDYEYDVVHNPKRPLVSGLVTRADVARYLVLFSVLVLGANALIAWPLVACVALDLAYGLFQLPLERWSSAVRDRLLVNLAAVYPVNVGLSVYTLFFFLQRTGAGFQAAQAWLVVAYACAFLHFEFARKTGWPTLATPGERLYSLEVGMPGALALAAVMGFAAPAIALALFAPWTKSGAEAVTGWLPLAVLAPMAFGLSAFARSRTRRHAARPPAVAYLFTFYLTMFAHALGACSVAFGAAR
jgi:hypothetical protein